MANNNQIDYILCSQRWRSSAVSKNKTRSWMWQRPWTPFAKFKFKLKKVGKTTISFRYDLNQISYDYTVEVRNIFKGLDLIECLTNYGQRFVTLQRRQGSRQSPRKRNEKKSKMAAWGGLTDSCEEKRSEKQNRKENIYPFECRVPKNSWVGV